MSSISAIGSPLLPSLLDAGKSTAGLAAQLARYQVQLADWVSCPSCNTAEGKAKIRELSDKVNDTQQRIKAADIPSQSIPPPVQVENSSTDHNRSRAAPPLNSAGFGVGSVPSPWSATGTSGALLNAFA